MKSKRIAVTGYGPFMTCTVNPSAVVVERLSQMSDQLEGIELETEVIPVSYASATKCSTQLCKDSKPDFIVHIGVSGEWEDTIQLELQSFSHGYWGVDVDGKVPFMNCSPTDVQSACPKILKTRLNCEKDCKNSMRFISRLTSDNPGRFLCAFIYYMSLSQHNGNALFIHVPPFNEEFSTPEQITAAVLDIIKEVANQI
ncbi:Pyroglutamyl-peptidase I [Aphelenchoides bicaudatus]|nr:Pyroglutamyl-peptidase I [Aphelenchoides bicaudatus]